MQEKSGSGLKGNRVSDSDIESMWNWGDKTFSVTFHSMSFMLGCPTMPALTNIGLPDSVSRHQSLQGWCTPPPPPPPGAGAGGPSRQGESSSALGLNGDMGGSWVRV